MSVTIYVIARHDGRHRLAIHGAPWPERPGERVVASREYPSWDAGLEAVLNLRKRLIDSIGAAGLISPGPELSRVIAEMKGAAP